MKHTIEVEYQLKGTVEVEADTPEEAQYIVDNGLTDKSGVKFNKFGVMLKTLLEMLPE